MSVSYETMQILQEQVNQAVCRLMAASEENMYEECHRVRTLLDVWKVYENSGIAAPQQEAATA